MVSGNKDEVIELINTYIPICVQCGRDFSMDDPDDGLKCKDCGYDLLKSAKACVIKHFKGKIPDEITNMFYKELTMDNLSCNK